MKKLRESMDGTHGRLLMLTILLGVLVGLFCAAFSTLWHLADHAFWAEVTQPWMRIVVSVVAGLVIGIILQVTFDPGTMATIIRHFHDHGRLPLRDNKPILPASFIGLIAGQSAGPEGALTQAGGSLGTWLADRTGNPQLARLLTLAGMGAGFGAFLGAPVGGALLWLEMLHRRSLEYYEAIIPTIVASCVGYVVMATVTGTNMIPPWHLADVQALSRWDLLTAVAVGMACVPFVKVYIWLFHGIRRLLAHVPMPIIARCTLAGLIIGLLGYFFPLSYFYGGAQMHDLLVTSLPVTLLIGTLLAKMVAASVTIRGHWQGGLIVPHIFMGAIVGKLICAAAPGLDPTITVLACMAAFNAAATQTPLASALIVIALTSSGNPVPIFLASVAGYVVGQNLTLIDNKQSRTESHNFHLVGNQGGEA
jgi:H+/Cl- antiporter ClcA